MSFKRSSSRCNRCSTITDWRMSRCEKAEHCPNSPRAANSTTSCLCETPMHETRHYPVVASRRRIEDVSAPQTRAAECLQLHHNRALLLNSGRAKGAQNRLRRRCARIVSSSKGHFARLGCFTMPCRCRVKVVKNCIQPDFQLSQDKASELSGRLTPCLSRQSRLDSIEDILSEAVE